MYKYDRNGNKVPVENYVAPAASSSKQEIRENFDMDDVKHLKWYWWVLIVLVLLLVCYGVYRYFYGKESFGCGLDSMEKMGFRFY